MNNILAFVTLFLILAPARADEPTKRPFNGHNLDGWKFRGDASHSKWKVGVAALEPKDPAKILFVAEGRDSAVAELVNTEAHSVDIYTEAKYGDCIVEVEVMVPKGSNSGIYFQGEYEVQVFDSYGNKDLKYGDMGGIYDHAPPRVNASKKPGEWQKFVIEFQAPKFNGDKKIANAKFLKVTLNGQIIHEDVELKRPTTSSLTGKEHPTGPLMLQGDHGPVAYRNLIVRAMEK